MRRFSPEQAAIAVELEQMVVDYWREVDFNGGANAADFFTEDAVAELGAIAFTGHAGVRQWYAERQARILEEQADGVRTSRHSFQNLHIDIESSERAVLSFLIVTYAGGGVPPLLGPTAPVAVSDASFACRREAGGQWRIHRFTGAPVFIGEEDFARKALTGE